MTKRYAFNGRHQNNLPFLFFVLLGDIYCALFILHIFVESLSGRSGGGVGGMGVNLDVLSHGSDAAPGITHCQSTEAFNSFSCADMPVPLTPPSEKDEQTCPPPPPSPDVGVSALCTHLLPSLAFHPSHFMSSFFPLHFFFLEVMGWGLGSGDCHTGQLIWNNEEFKPLLSHLSGFVADRIKNWKGGSESHIVCACVWERKRAGCMFVCSCTYSVVFKTHRHWIFHIYVLSFSVQPEERYIDFCDVLHSQRRLFFFVQ